MATYAEYLKSLGATDDDIKVMDTPIGRRAFEQQQAALVESQRLRDLANRDLSNYKDWYEKEATPAFQANLERAIKAEAEAARARTVILSSQDEGMLRVAKDMGYEVTAPPTRTAPPANPDGNGFDASKYFTRDEIQGIARREGLAIATMSDIEREHARLFPDKPLNARALYEMSTSSGKPFEQVWMETFNVAAARTAYETAQREAYEKRLRDEGAAKEREIWASRVNPDMRPLVPSSRPLAPRSEGTRTKQPWEIGSPEQLSAERVDREAKKILSGAVTTTH